MNLQPERASALRGLCDPATQLQRLSVDAERHESGADSGMNVSSAAARISLEARARQSLGASSDAIHEMVADAVDRHDIKGARIVRRRLRTRLAAGCAAASLRGYQGLDAVRYERFPEEGEFTRVDLDDDHWPVVSAGAVLVAAVETIEHLENPWAFVRHLSALAAPGGWVILTTPNQLSLLSMMTLVLKRRFSAFQDAHYPAHKTALLENDLRRIAEASGLEVVELGYSLRDGFRSPASTIRQPSRGAGPAPCPTT